MDAVDQHKVMRELITSSASAIETAVRTEIETFLIECKLQNVTERRDAALGEMEEAFRTVDDKVQTEVEHLEKKHEKYTRKSIKLLKGMTARLEHCNQKLLTLDQLNASDIKALEEKVEALEREIGLLTETCLEFHAEPHLMFSDDFKNDVRKMFNELKSD